MAEKLGLALDRQSRNDQRPRKDLCKRPRQHRKSSLVRQSSRWHLATGRRWQHDLWENDGVVTQRSPRRQGGPEVHTLHVGNLDFSVLREDLKMLFERVAEVVDVRMDFDHTDRSLGTAQVLFRSEIGLRDAYNEYRRTSLDGRPLWLSFYPVE
ncbi:MAG: hypothetical protein KVP17_002737 [Porospora cf. gigantea B]|uniref:uncharacterized protein n=1 Tax=Porospora cf. gigantea B TaxID=2853592 RepID=UPI003571A237|nr:MAG: hypothetical protein KVP17_002737 [Porospora cf. gigantea B]